MTAEEEPAAVSNTQDVMEPTQLIGHHGVLSVEPVLGRVARSSSQEVEGSHAQEDARPLSTQENCTICDAPAIPWSCCGASLLCIACTRQARNAVPQESYHLPHPRCPSCRADYPRDFDFESLFCRVCTQTTEVLPEFSVRTPADAGGPLIVWGANYNGS